MDDFDISDYDFCGTNAGRPSKFSYAGKLYHYTDKVGCDGIFSPKDSNGNSILLPPDCISLRFTSIEDMKRNDEYERKYVQEIVRLVVSDMLKNGEITESFANTVCAFYPTGVGFNSIITDKIDKEFGSIIRWGYDKLDYYIACFSTNSDNEYIMKSFNYPIRLAFSSAFSDPSEFQRALLCDGGPTLEFVNLYRNLPPYSNISQCSLYDHTLSKLRKVLYSESEKYMEIENRLIDIYRRIPKDKPTKCQEKFINKQIEEMYSLYDAIFKSSEGNYYKEEEVRFVIAVRKEDRHSLLEQYGFVFDHDLRSGKNYLYMPISKQFLIGGDDHA